ncbi:PREDICTED: transcription factor bHLH115-like [Camelina sativa]|nr:PREDICTED: transcription factor bHLH115-like [Camelina sativa]
MVNHARDEAQKLKDLNSSLQEKIKEVKDEKSELRDEKHKLKIEKERMEQQLKEIKTQPQPQPCFLPNPPSLSQAQAPGSKLVPFTTYPGFAMWQFMPPAAVDTSQDHVLRPPVA